MENKQKKGISLIVLVITIIVMIILAAAIILSLNGSGIIGKATEAKTDSDKANLLHAANVALAEYELKVNTGEEVEDELSVYVKKQLKSQGFKQEEIDKLIIYDDKRTIKYVDKPHLIHYGIIPEGGTYYSGITFEEAGNASIQFYSMDYYKDFGGVVYSSGDEFPTPQLGDIYVYGDYHYCYGGINSGIPSTVEFCKHSQNTGWAVVTSDITKTSYGEFLTEINSIPVTSLNMTFVRCSNMISAPVIPENIIFMGSTFGGCTSLTGTVEINAAKLTDYETCFAGVEKTIVLTGTCKQLDDIVQDHIDSSGLTNVTVKSN